MRNYSLAALALAAAGAFIWTALSGEVRAHEPLAVAPGDGAWVSTHVDGERRPFLGVTLEEEVDYDEGGARITRIVEGSAAEEAGLEAGDVIVGFDGKTIRSPGGLTRKMRELGAGDRVEIVVVRDGRERTFDVELGERSHGVALVMPEINEQLRESLGELENLNFDFDMERLRGLGERIRVHVGECENDDCSHYTWSWSGRPRLGVQLTDTTPELRRHLGGSGDAGMLVTRIVEKSPAEAAGIRVGDLIVTVDGKEVDGTFDIIRAIGDRAGESVEVEVIRDGSPMTIDVALPEAGNDGPRGTRRVPSESAIPRELAREMARAGREAAAEARRIAVEARSVAHETRRAEVESARRALSLAREELRETRAVSMREAREAMREALELQREALREAREEVHLRGAVLL